MNALLDALDYAGQSLGKGGRAVRGVLAGRMDEALAAIPFSDAMGVTDASRAVSGQDILGRAGFSTGSDMGDTLAGIGVDIATDPLSFLGAGLVGRAMTGAGKAASAFSRPLRGLRDRIGVVDGSGRSIWGKAAAITPEEAVPMKQAVDGSRVHAGGYYPQERVAVVSNRVEPGMSPVRRHETMHGIIGEARATGAPEAVPGLVGRAAARLPDFEDATAPGWKRALGLLAEETATHMAEGRGLMGQLQAGSKLFTNGFKRDAYADHLAEASPLVSELYWHAFPAAQKAALGSTLAAAASGGYLAGTQLFGGS